MSDIFKKFFTGINYWSSKDATIMWRNYDEKVIEKDMQLLKDAGITVLRVFPSWNDFQPLTAFFAVGGVYEYGINDEIRPDTEAGRAGVSEEMCKHFESFCDIADKYGMKLIVGLLTGHMSFANLIPPALGNLNMTTDSAAIRWEIKFIKYFVKRFRHHKAIAGWDLGNEVDNLREGCTKDQFYVWTSILADSIRSSDNTRPVMSGVGNFNIDAESPNLYDMKDMCDINTVHTYNIFATTKDPVNSTKSILDQIFKCRLSEDISNMPTFLQEFGAIGYANCSKQGEAEYYRASVLSAFSHGFYGTMYWCAFDQGHLTFPPYNWNNIGSDYGFYDRQCMPKPIVAENLRINTLTDQLGDCLPKYSTDCTIIAPQECSPGLDTLRSTFILAKRAGLDARFCYALDQLEDSPLYILPSLDHNKAIPNTRLNQLLERVANGSTLYISLDKAHFRSICDLAGVILENRVDTEQDITINFGNNALPAKAAVLYDIYQNGCEVLATDQNGHPIFVKNKYGKGCIYTMFAPIEKYLAEKNGAYYQQNTPDYESIYKEISQNINNKIFKCNSRFILHTEHKINENEYYIFAINYNNKPESGQCSISSEYELSVLWGNGYMSEEISLNACDAVVLKAVKKQ